MFSLRFYSPSSIRQSEAVYRHKYEWGCIKTAVQFQLR